MMYSVLLDQSVLESCKLSVNESLCILKLHYDTLRIPFPYRDSHDTCQELVKKGYLSEETKEGRTGYTLTPSGGYIIQRFALSEKRAATEVKLRTAKRTKMQLEKRAKMLTPILRAEFKGLKPGSMGSRHACETKLVRWFKLNPEYTDEDVLRSAKLYISSLRGVYTFLQQADYFISKVNGKDEMSRLSQFIEEDGDGVVTDDGWTSELI